MKGFVFLLTFMLAIFSADSQEFNIPRLSPFPVNLEKEKISLKGNWLFSSSPEKSFWTGKTRESWKNISVPGEWTMQGYKVEKGQFAGYIKEFNIPTSWKNKRIKLRCNEIFSESFVYINGSEAGSHIGGFTPFELDITSFIHSGKNNIAISVRSESLADSLASASKYAVHSLGGITRDIFIFALPEVNIASFHIQTTFDNEYKNAILTTEVAICNELKTKSDNLSVCFKLTDPKGKVVTLKKNEYELKPIESKVTESQTISIDITEPMKWDSENPNLYVLTCELKQGGKLLQQTSRKVGFRQVEVRGNELFVNNFPVKLRGVCRHEVMPLRGRSLEGDIWKKDVEIFRSGNVNYIRTSHYPPDEALLDACDSLGMFVELEAPFCWAHETKVPEDKHYQLLVNQHIEMVNRDKSHPSIIIWSMGNESNLYEEYFQQAAAITRKMDPTRPRIFSQWGPDSDKGDLEIGNHHYPGPTGPETYKNSKRPIIFDEYCHLNAYNRLELSADPGVRNMWGELLNRMWNDMYYSKGVLGGAIWAGIDDSFFLPDGKIVGYGTWGPIDGWRREKPEFWNMKKVYSPVKIEMRGNIDSEGNILFEVENRHNFTNLSVCRFQWATQNGEGSVAVNLSPKATGTFKIALSEKARESNFIELNVVSPLGYVIDQYKFTIKPEQVMTDKRNDGFLKFSENEKELVISSTTGTYSINKLNGLLLAKNSNNETVLKQTPELMILPLNGEGRGIQMTGEGQNFDPYNPVCKFWVASSIQITQNNDVIKIQVSGSYQEADGSFCYLFHANGKVDIEYDFNVKKAVSPRQIGLVFSASDSYTELSWKRNGFWSVYPPNHIARLEGTANLYNKTDICGLAGPVTEPAHDWNLDRTDAGSNDFRSTKESIISASLKNKNGSLIKILSNGKQHFRAWKESNTIRFLIADYNNAGKEQFLVSHAERDYKSINIGDNIKGKVTFLINDN